MTTASYKTSITLTHNDLKTPAGASSIRSLKKIINRGFKEGALNQFNNVTNKHINENKGTYWKYAGQHLAGFKFKIIDEEIYVSIKRYENNQFQIIGVINSKDKNFFRMALQSCSSYTGVAKIVGGTQKVSDGKGHVETFLSGEYGINLEVTFYFREQLATYGFHLPKNIPVIPLKDIDEYVVFDLELIQGRNLFPEIIEIGAIKYKNNKELIRYQKYIKPKQHIPYHIRQITSIDDDTVKDASPIEVVLPEFLAFVGDLPLIGHDIGNNDIKIIRKEMYRMNLGFLQNQIIDTLKISRETYILDNYKLSTIKEYLDIDVRSHEAINDCLVSNKIFLDYKNTLN